MKDLTVIGRVELTDIVKFAQKAIPAKVDTGADLSSLGVSDLQETESGISFYLFDKSSKYYTGEKIELHSGEYTYTRIANSFGSRQIRYKIQTSVRIKGRLIKGTFTLADRSNKLYPILIGRRLLNKKFIVDVSQGKPLRDEEKKRIEALKKDMHNLGYRD